MNHTPSPWHIDPDDREGMEFNNHILDKDGLAICFMANPGEDRQDEYDANARLIADAPQTALERDQLTRKEMGERHRAERSEAMCDDLLTALKLLVSDVQDYEAWQRPCHALDVAVAAIAKAEGRS